MSFQCASVLREDRVRRIRENRVYTTGVKSGCVLKMISYTCGLDCGWSMSRGELDLGYGPKRAGN